MLWPVSSWLRVVTRPEPDGIHRDPAGAARFGQKFRIDVWVLVGFGHIGQTIGSGNLPFELLIRMG